MNYQWHFGLLGDYTSLWLHGTAVTLVLTIAIAVFGTVLAVALALALASRLWAVRVLARVYLDVFRAIPALVLIGTLYFCLPLLLGIRIGPLETAFLALSLNLAPFAEECIRGGLEAIPRVQGESARALGFNRWLEFRYVTGPQAVRTVLPSLIGQYITTLKLTSLAATIGVPEIWHVTGQVITATSAPIEARLAGTAWYIALVLPLTWLTTYVERRLRVPGFLLLSER